jgi:hypothetical protein
MGVKDRMVTFIIGLLLSIFGIASFRYPEVIWKWFDGGWKLKNVEPSEEYIFTRQIIGIIVTVIGIFFMIWGVLSLFGFSIEHFNQRKD